MERIDFNQTSESEALNFNAESNTNIGGKTRAKTALRLKYEAECCVIRKKLGSIEDIRQELRLSQRKLCQLLMVDPSAWTRWIKNEATIPPHIYRSLQWYLALIDKKPEWHPQNAFLGAFRPESAGTNKIVALKAEELAQNQRLEIEDFKGEVQSVKKQARTIIENIEKLGQVQFSWKLLVLINTLFLVYVFLFRS